MKSNGHVTIEQTSKKYKFRLLLAVLGMIISVIWGMFAFAGADINGGEPNLTTPVVIFAVSILLWIITKITIWWNHG